MRKRAIAVGVGAFLLGGGIAGAFLYPGVVRREVVSQARARGVELAPTQIDVAWGKVTLRDTHFSMLGNGISGTAKTVTIALELLSPTRIDADGVDVAVSGSPPELLGQVEEAKKTTKPVALPPMFAKGVRIAWPDLHLTVEDATVTGEEGKASLSSPSMSLGKQRIGSIAASLRAGDGKSVIAIGGDDPETSPVRLDVDTSGQDVLVSGLLRSLPVDPTRKIVVDAKTTGRAVKDGYVGTVEVKVRGVALPVPREVASLVATDAVSVKGDISITHDHGGTAHVDRGSLTKATVTVGSVVLGGDVSGVWTAGERATAQGTLKGQVSCALVAGAAARSQLGDLLGSIAGGLARGAVTGTVAITATLDVDTARKDVVRVVPVVAPGCGLGGL